MLSIISLKEFELKKNSFIIIDIRSVEKYNNNHIPNSINISVEKLIVTPQNYLDKNKTYCLYCTKCISSLNIGKILSTQGYKMLSLNGEYENWILNQDKDIKKIINQKNLGEHF